MVEPERLQKAIWRRVACWISKATRAQAHTSAHVRSHTHKRARARALVDTHIHKQDLLLFHGNKSFVNLPQCYVTRTLPFLLRK